MVYICLLASGPAVLLKKKIGTDVPAARWRAVGGEYSNPTYVQNFGNTREGGKRGGRENSMG
jgi:hypothetical protein